MFRSSVAEPGHFSSAPVQDIFFRLRLQHFGSDHSRLRPTSSPKYRFWYKTFEKSKKRSFNKPRFCPKNEKKLQKNRFNEYKKINLVLYLNVGRFNKYRYYLLFKNMYSTVNNEQWKSLIISFFNCKKGAGTDPKYRLRLQLKF